jgi:FMN phosphatase YigB (HAD superfamily)
MPLTLEKYAELLDDRGEPKPLGPQPIPFSNAKAHLKPLRDVRCVIWSGYGTLLLITGGELFLLNPDPVMRKIALDKTIREFKMWQSMTRKPGEPSEYLQTVLQQVADRITATRLGNADAVLRVEDMWLGVLRRLVQKEYTYDQGFYGDQVEYCRKISYYYVRASQGVSAFPGECAALRQLAARHTLGIHANGQCVTSVQLLRLLAEQNKLESLADVFDSRLCFWSHAIGSKKETERGFQPLVAALAERGWAPRQVLYVGSDADRDIIPAKKRGFATALLLADRTSARVLPQQLRAEKSRPDCLLTAFEQTLEIV